jgi:hypothetical protein
MPQTPLGEVYAKTPTGPLAPLNEDALGNLRTTGLPALTLLDITAATVVKAAPGRVGKVQVIVAGSTAGSINDCLATSQIAVTNQVAVLAPLSTSQITAIPVDFVFKTGICIQPGTGQTLAVNYE